MAGTTMRREVELSYELHRAVVPYLRRDWPSAEKKIRWNIARFNSRPRAKLAQGWVREWECAVDDGPEAVAAVALMSGDRGNDLRQVSPLVGVLPQEIRTQVLQRVRGHASR